MATTKDEDLNLTKRDILVSEFLANRSIPSVPEAPDELIDEANKEADLILGAGNAN